MAERSGMRCIGGVHSMPVDNGGTRMGEQGESPDRARSTPLLVSLVWTPVEMAAVLAVVTHYPLRGGTPERGADLVSQLGGSHAVRHLLRACQTRLPDPSGWVLDGFLSGSTRAQVVAAVSARGPMHPSMVYQLIQTLPATLMPSFLAQLEQGDAVLVVPPLPALLHTLHICRGLLQSGEVEHLVHLASIEQLVIRGYRE